MQHPKVFISLGQIFRIDPVVFHPAQDPEEDLQHEAGQFPYEFHRLVQGVVSGTSGFLDISQDQLRNGIQIHVRIDFQGHQRLDGFVFELLFRNKGKSDVVSLPVFPSGDEDVHLRTVIDRSGNGRADAMKQFVVRSFLLIVLLDEFEQFRDIEGTGRGYFRFRPLRHHIGNDGMKRIRVVQQYCVFSFHVYSANFLMRSSAS